MEVAESILTPIDTIIIVAYLGAVLVLGYLFSRYVKSSGDFILAGKSLPFWAIGMSVVVSDIGAIDMVSGAGAAYKYGLAQANFDWLGSVPAMVIVAFVFVPFYWRSGVCTLPEFLGRRYGPAVRFFQAVIWLGFLLSMLAVMLWTSAVFLNTVLGMPNQAAIWLTVFVVGIYTILGGLAAVVVTDAMQMVIMFIGAGALLGLSLWEIGGWTNMVQTISAMGPQFEQHFNLLISSQIDTPYPWSGMLMGLGIVLSTAYFSSNQAVIQRVLGARSEWDAKASMLLAAFLKLLIPVLVLLPGLAALALYPELEDPDKAVPKLVRELLPPGLAGLVFAAFFAALMSSVDSYLNSATTIIISDGYKPGSRALSGKEPDDRHCLLLTRVLTGVLIVAAGFLAPYIDQFETIYTAMQTLFSLFQGPTLAVLVLGVFWRRANAWGGFAGLLLGVICSTCLSLVGESLFGVVSTLEEWLGFRYGPLSGNPFLYVAFLAFAFSLIVTVIVSLLTPPPSKNQIRGLVFGEVVRDEAIQTLLKERIQSD